MKWQTRRSWGFVAALLGVVAGLSPASAQRMIVVTEARNAVGETARLQASSVDLDVQTVLPGARSLPGAALTGPILLDHQGTGLFVSTGQRWNGGDFDARHQESALASFRIAPFDHWPDADNRTAPGWREWPAAVLRDDSTLSYILVLAGLSKEEDGSWRGQLQTRPWPPEGTPGRVPAMGRRIALDVAPRFVLPLGGSMLLCIGGTPESEVAALQRVNGATGDVESPIQLATGDHGALQQNLVAAICSPDGATLWLLFSSLTGSSPASWLHAMDARSLSPLGPPVELPGIADLDRPHVAADIRGRCWVATRTPGTDFGQVVRLSIVDSGGGRTLEQDQSYALVGVQQRLFLSAEPISGDLMVAIDNRVEYWRKGERSSHGHNLDAPIAMLAWSGSGPVIGEGNRMHRIALPDCAPEATVALQQGWIVDAMAIPANALPQPDTDADGLDDNTELRIQTRLESPDTDNDGIPDGSDPYPHAPSPWLETSAEVVIPYTAVGRQFRALKIESHGASDAQWRIDFDQEALPWLVVHPRTFRGSGHAYMGVNPELFDPEGVVAGSIEVALAGKPRGKRPGYTAAYSPATVHIRVAPPRDPLRGILWLWPAAENPISFRDPADPQRLRALGDLASGYPNYFSSVEHFGPFSGELEEYSIVVVPARAAAEGALTQKALFDYLSGGGAVLFLGAHLQGEHYRDLSAWLAPLDVQVDMGTPAQGSFDAAGDAELVRHWQQFSVHNGSAFHDEAPESISVSASEQGAVFVAKTHGYGRIAMLAAATPLESEALENGAHRGFAQDLLYWLSRAGYAVEDQDGDGLLDAIEDRNDNGAFDEGETGWLDPDTDGDGIPDGMEDTNRNGEVDPGETDPRVADTDGDGVNDGADGSPVG